MDAAFKIYKEGVFPYWWLINDLDSKEKWVKLNEVIDENDTDVGMIFQFNYPQIENYQHGLIPWIQIHKAVD